MSDLQWLRLMTNPSLSWKEWLLAFVAGGLTAFALRAVFPNKRRTLWQNIAVILLMMYLFLVLSSLVLVRPVGEDYTWELELFWSYRHLLREGNRFYLWENVLNIVLFVPAGFLMKMAFPQMKIRKLLLVGVVISLGLELMQLGLKRGLFELDDIVHNTVGMGICGCIAGMLMKMMYSGKQVRI